VTGGEAGYGQRWYEVTDYIIGPIIGMPSDLLLMNRKVWEGLPEDFQQILLEETAKLELEQLRMAPYKNYAGLQDNIDKGMEFIRFTPEIYKFILEEVTLAKLVPGWLKRVGGPDTPQAALFNEKYGPVVGYKINPDGTIVKTGE
jgi:TRAP-type C4-dicarboxylate transport system substrate-binding protein